jgi:hypothetical protein
MTSVNLTPKELDSVGELLTKLERVVAVTLSDFHSDMEMERAKAKKPSAKATKALVVTFEKAWFERCSGFGDLAKLLADIADVGSSCGRDMLGVRKLAKGLKSAIANNHLAGALGSQEALVRLASNTGDAVAEVEVLAEQIRNGRQEKGKVPAELDPDDWVEVPYRKQTIVQMIVARSTCYDHSKNRKMKEVIRSIRDGNFIIRRRYLSRYVKESLLKIYMERPAYTSP